MILIDGKLTANEIQSGIKKKVLEIEGRKPGLAFILTGDDPASQSYVRSKRKACASVGMISTVIELPKRISQSDLLKQIDQLNRQPEIDGILVQLPLPPHIDEQAVMAAILPAKDVDGFHPLNVGKMLLGQEGGFLPCTPHGIHLLLQRYAIPIQGKHVVIIGRSNIVGKPLAAILMQKKPHCNATVTIAHSQSERLTALTRSADILVAAIGSPFFVKKEMVKPGATVIDVGINRLPTGKLVGDVDFDAMAETAGHITPVPGGVGPMTIAMLLQNTLAAFLKLTLCLLFIVSCQKSSPKDPCTHFEGTAMTIPYRITIGKTLFPKEKKSICEILEKTFSEVHDTFDNWNPQSEVSRLNHAPQDALVPLSKSLQDLLSLCGKVVALSGGRFDPTIAPLEHLWRTSKQENKIPAVEALQSACEAVGWNHISIHNGIFRKDRNDTQLDLCAVTKGICIDWIVERLQKLGYADLMAEWGGEIRASGHHPSNRDWTVQLDPALKIKDQPIAPIPLRNCAIASSVHSCCCIIDPLTTAPLEKTEHSIASATVIAPTCSLADALATTATLFHNRKEAESWAQEVVALYPEVSFWILSYRKDR